MLYGWVGMVMGLVMSLYCEFMICEMAVAVLYRLMWDRGARVHVEMDVGLSMWGYFVFDAVSEAGVTGEGPLGNGSFRVKYSS